MAVKSDDISFDGIIRHLIQIANHVELRKTWCSKICNDCQQLVAPWPRAASDAVDKTTEQKSAVENSEEPDKQTGNQLTSQEVEELRLVEDALNKAGKMKQIFKHKFIDENLPEVPDSKNLDDALGMKSSVATSAENIDQRTTAKPNPQPSIRTRQENESQIQATTSHSKTRAITLKNNCSSLNKVNEEEKQSSGVAVITQTELNVLRTSALSNSSSSRPRSSASRRSSASSSSLKYKPAHLSAPFRTVSEVRPQTRTSQARKTVQQAKSLSTSKNKVAVASTNQTNKCLPTASNSVNNFCKSDIAISQTRIVSTVVSGRLPVVPLGDGDSLCGKSDDVSDWLNRIPEAAVTVGDSDKANHAADANKPLAVVGKNRFDLLRDGSRLKFPAELGRALSSNYKVREKLKLSTTRQRRIREGESSAENFLQLLQKHNKDSDPITFSKIATYNRLSDFMDWLKDLLDLVKQMDVDDESSTFHVIEAQKVVEFVQNEFSSLSEILSSLHLDELRSDYYPDQRMKLKLSDEDSITQWLAFDLDSGDRLLTSRSIKYQSEHQLIKYLTLVHQIQLLKLQKLILTDAGSQAVKMLNGLSPRDRRFPQLYRSFYSLITSLGQSFPAIVNNIEDEDNSGS